MRKNPRSIKVHLLRWLVIPFFAMLFSLMIFITIISWILLGEIRKNQTTLLSSISNTTRQYLMETGLMIRTLTSLIGSVELDTYNTLLKEFRTEYTRFSSLYYLNSEGIVLLHNTDTYQITGFDLSYETFFTESRMSRGIYFSEPYISINDGSVVIIIAHPLIENDEFAGLIFGEMDLDLLEETIQEMNAESPVSSFIVDRSNVLIAHPDSNFVHQSLNYGNYPLLKSGREDDGPRVFFDDYSESWRIGSIRTMENGWKIGASQEVFQAFRPLISLAVTSLLIIVLYILIIFIVLLKGIRKISRPLTDLAAKADRVAESNESVSIRFPEKTYLEARTLNSSFDRMVDALESRNRELKEHKDHLEDQVKSRTRALEGEIQQRNIIEQELKTAKINAEQANRAKSRFLANMSHELRTPLNGILGYAQILGKDRSLSSSQLEGIRIIERCGEHLLNLINQILDLSKIEENQMELHESSFNLPNFLRGIVDMVSLKALEKGLEIIYLPDGDLPRYIEGDEKKLSQILLNLLSNAVKFTAGGTITFRISPAPDHPGRIRFAVEDTGIGIPGYSKQVIFSPFVQAGHHTRTIEGTGLGLSISRHLVRLLGGELTVEDNTPKGSIFRFDIPVREGVMETEEYPVNMDYITGYNGPLKKVLIVDDKTVNRMVLAEMLEPLGFGLKEAGNGQEALKIMSGWAPDLILLDMIMPVMDGYQFARAVRQNEAWEDIRIIAVTASTDTDRNDSVLKCGCDVFLHKPVIIKDLLHHTGNLLNISWVTAAAEEAAAARISSEEMTLPPREVLENIYALAEDGDMQELAECLGSLESGMESETEEYARFIDIMKDLVFQFNDREIQRVIRSSLEGEYE